MTSTFENFLENLTEGIIECPLCKKNEGVLGSILRLISEDYNLSGITGGGMASFRKISLYQCVECNQYFYIQDEFIRATKLLKEESCNQS